MRCPRCRSLQDVLRYVMLGMVEEFLDETTPIYKCPTCNWLFAPTEQAREEAML